MIFSCRKLLLTRIKFHFHRRDVSQELAVFAQNVILRGLKIPTQEASWKLFYLHCEVAN
jgi:hypothetical protein